MILDAGQIVEFDSPSELLKNDDAVDESSDRNNLLAMAA
jgi:hypothetical protein